MTRNLLLASSLTVGMALSSSIGVNAQQYYNQTPEYIKQNSVWPMFRSIKLNMNNGTVSYPLVSLGGEEGGASVSDPVTGELLFYSDGGTCWKRNDTAMTNGTGLLGNSTNNYYSSAQGVCIVPMPGEDQKYYLFSLESSASFDAPTSLKLYYSIVDMSLANGSGDIVASSKNTLLDGNSLLGEGILAIQGNNCDVWLLSHDRQTPTFKAYHITANGIDPTPVISTAGGQIQGSVTLSFAGLPLTEDAYAQATLAVSPDRTKLAVSCQNLASLGLFPITSATGRTWGGLLCDFNATTGEVSNAILMDTLGQYNAAFSPDGSKLYYTTTVTDINSTPATQINQADISSNDSATIVGSAVTLPVNPQSDLVSLKMYNDTIYLTNRTNRSLDRINNPNLAGAACDYQSNAIIFSGAAFLGYSLPNEVVRAAAPDTVESVVFDTLICGSDWTNGIALQSADTSITETYLWNTGATNSSITVTTAGTYWVKYSNTCHSRVDTFVLNGMYLNPIITTDEFVLGTTTTYDSYQWCLDGEPIPGATVARYTPAENGDYTVIVSKGSCTETSDVYPVNNVSVDEVHPIARQIRVYPNPAKDVVYIQAPVPVNLMLLGMDGRTLIAQPESTQLDIADLAAGIYILQITDKDMVPMKMEKLVKPQ